MPAHLGKTLLIANPAAQRGNGAKAADIASELLGEWLGEASFCHSSTDYPGHATDIAANEGGSFDTVIALGGDGVVHEVINGLMRIPQAQRPRFGLIPVGSGNDYARTLGMSECVPDAVAQFIDAHERVLDIGQCNGEFFAETLSFGLDAAIALDTVERRKRTGEQGTVLYLKSGIGQLLHHLDTYAFKATLDDGSTIADSIHMMAVQIGQTYGGGFRICPEANPADGLLDICYASAPMRIPEATFKFLRAKNAHHVKFKNIHFARSASLKLSFDKRPPCQIDGEPHVADSYDITCIPAALRVLSAI